MSQNNSNGYFETLFRKPVYGFILTLLGMSAAYFTTIGSIRVSLAEKAETVLVETIDKKLTRLEVIIKEGMISKDHFFEFRNDIESRLTRIEFHLTKKTGD
ncbi:MAG: hypothetical protein GY865_00880 [candidate division Zixibacteria bacterium]|nr:hypothetical protein [candidate division Zixibacteria bacterium]